MKSQSPSTKLQTNLKFQYSMTKTQNSFGIWHFGHCDLPFDFAQGGELVEPFDICDLLFGILSHFIAPVDQFSGKATSFQHLSVTKVMVGKLVFQNHPN